MPLPSLLKPLSLSLTMFVSLQTPLALAQTTGQAGLSKLEQAMKRGKMRRSCIALAKQVAPQITTAPSQMASPPNSGFAVAYEKCLALCDDEKNYVPDAATLKSALVATKAAPPSETILTIRTKPGNAKIRVLNIKPPYQDKMQVKTGLYHIAIEKEGFALWKEWLKVEGEHYNYLVNLIPLAKNASTSQKTNVSKNKGSAKKAGLSLAEQSRLAAQKRARRAAKIKAKVAAKRKAKKKAAAKKAKPLSLAQKSALAAQKRANRAAIIKAKVAAKKAAKARAKQLAAK